ncbi:hypothetical protein N7468_006301 [Penicillium chermesinum]|uniref:DNA-directed RNA polymerase subunit n=1 Tax=Penicillium chermesinum TaxID=63820 RepID=A0A9W9NRY6_9EURO|nr:uncharacterized protein N7468_006301 [Penicillium chermesinum]KAJ5225076.1 hypothetical protein N7468_006301 [Penicillium chermesinum]
MQDEKKFLKEKKKSDIYFELHSSTEQREYKMAVEAMDIDTPPRASTEVERKRKSKNKDPSSPSKKRKADADKSSKSKSRDQKSISSQASAGAPDPESPFSLTKATLYLPLSPISISATHALSSLQAEHLSPLLLTYFPPLKGIVLAYSQASISSFPPSSQPKKHSDNPEPLTMAKTADEYGVLYVYLTATFLVFRPQRGQTLEGWVNVQSEGFLGAVVFNLFSVGIESNRLPRDWKWIAPGAEDESNAPNDVATTDDESSAGKAPVGFDAEKEHFQPGSVAEELDADEDEEEEVAASGYFRSVSGHRVRGTVKFRVVDIDVIPGSERDRGKQMAWLVQRRRLPQRNSRVIPITAAPVSSAPVVDIDLEPTETQREEKGKSEKKEKKVKKEKKEKEKKEKKEKKDKKEKKEKSKEK